MKVTEQKPTNQPHKQTKKQMKIEKYSPRILSKTKLGSFVIQIIVGNVTGTCISVVRLILFSKKCIRKSTKTLKMNQLESSWETCVQPIGSS